MLGYTCDSVTCYFEGLCGDSFLSEKDECDDVNIISRDGCNSNCEVEDNYLCLWIG